MSVSFCILPTYATELPSTQDISFKNTVEGSITSGSYLNTGFQYSIQSYYGAMGAAMSLALFQGSTRHWTLELECYPIEPAT